MIRSFKDRATEQLFQRRRPGGLPLSIQRTSFRKLLLLDAAESPQELRAPPANHLEKLSGDRAGQWSIRINDRYRLCFNWADGDAYDVEIVDYHQ